MARAETPCPDEHKHTAAPSGYVAFFAWAERMSRTHRQLKCSGCGRWQLWVPRQDQDAAPPRA
jgi:hypothetical protein